MFKEITIKHGSNMGLDLGQIAESLLFYETVNLVCSPSFFSNLVERSEIDSFLALMTSGKINVHLEDNIFGIQHKELDASGKLFMRVALLQGTNIDAYGRLERVLKETTNRSGFSRRLANKIKDNSKILLHSDSVIEHLGQDLDDEVYLKRLISQSVASFNPNLILPPEQIEIKVQKNNEGFIIETNLNLEEINKTNPQNKFDMMSVVGNMLNVRSDSALASNFGSDLFTNHLTNILIQEKVNNLLSRSLKNQGQINNFSEIVLENGGAIRNVINGGEKNLSDFIKLLEKADKFKSWLKNVGDDKNIVSEFYKSATSETWVDKIPGKTFRWSFFTTLSVIIDGMGAGGLGAATNVLISAGDAFLLDKLIKGWRPNSFVNDELEKFVKPL